MILKDKPPRQIKNYYLYSDPLIQQRLISNKKLMSASVEVPPPQPQQIAVQVQSVVKNVLQRFRQLKNIQVRPFIEDVITFLSIIGAYQYVSLSYQRQSKLQRWTSIEFSNTRTQAVLLLIFALYLIFLKLIYKLAYKYQTAPPKKIIPDNWQQMQESPSTIQQQPVPDPQQQKPLPPDSYSLLIQELINLSIYGFVFMFCTTAYTYISTFNKKFKLVNIEQVNYLIFWYVTANIFYAVGKLLGKLLKLKTLHHFGFMVGLTVLVIEIGLAHGLNTFIFI